MQPVHFDPPEILAPYIAFYGIWDVPEGFSEPYVSPPLGFCGFILCLDGLINARLNGKLFMKGPYCATGQVTAPMIGDVVGKNRILMVFIHPFGLHQFFGIDMSMLTNTSMPLSELLGEDAFVALIHRLQTAPGNNERIQVLNAFFTALLPVHKTAPKAARVLKYIHQNKGSVSVKDMEVNCYITSRTLERYFKTYIGLSPKEYAKIFRFKCLVNYIYQHPNITWGTLCEENGYYDQAHLTRYFVRYLHIKPTDIVNLDAEFISYLLQE